MLARLLDSRTRDQRLRIRMSHYNTNCRKFWFVSRVIPIAACCEAPNLSIFKSQLWVHLESTVIDWSSCLLYSHLVIISVHFLLKHRFILRSSLFIYFIRFFPLFVPFGNFSALFVSTLVYMLYPTTDALSPSLSFRVVWALPNSIPCDELLCLMSLKVVFLVS